MKRITLFGGTVHAVLRAAYRLQRDFEGNSGPTCMARCFSNDPSRETFWLITDYRAAQRVLDDAARETHRLGVRLREGYRLLKPLLGEGCQLQITLGDPVTDRFSTILRLARLEERARNGAAGRPEKARGEIGYAQANASVCAALALLYDTKAQLARAEQQDAGEDAAAVSTDLRLTAGEPTLGESKKKRREAAPWE